MLYVYTTQSVLIYLQKRLRSVIASRHTDHGRILSGARGGDYAPHEPRQFECCHAMKFTHACLVCPYITSVNSVVSGR